MKTRRFLWVFFMVLGFIVLCSMLSKAQPAQAQVPGDDFSLEGALEVFKKSVSPDDFERQLNSSDTKVNNLDLNGDGDIDYIRVIDRNEGNVHAFILQAVISENESQDVAVIELEKQANGKAVLQITGDEDIYGTETIIEPTTEVRVNAGTSTARTMVNVWAWPSVQYVYSPYYAGWVSPYRWSVRPIWWRPWRPVAYYTYNPWWQPYGAYYSVCYTHRIGYAHQLYRPIRTTSVYVYNRHHDQITRYRNNNAYYGEHNSRNRGRDIQSSGTYEHRNDDRQGGRTSSSQQGSVRDGASNQPDWRSNQGSSQNQSQSMQTRTSSVDGMNRSGEQRNERGSISSPTRNLPQRNMPTDFQRVPAGATPMNRTSGASIKQKQTSVPHGQTMMPSREFNRQAPASKPGRTQQVSKPIGDQHSNQRGR